MIWPWPNFQESRVPASCIGLQEQEAAYNSQLQLHDEHVTIDTAAERHKQLRHRSTLLDRHPSQTPARRTPWTTSSLSRICRQRAIKNTNVPGRHNGATTKLASQVFFKQNTHTKTSLRPKFHGWFWNNSILSHVYYGSRLTGRHTRSLDTWICPKTTEQIHPPVFFECW